MIEARAEERFDAAAVRWAGRLALETPDLELAELSARSSRSTRSLTSTRSGRSSPSPTVARAPRRR